MKTSYASILFVLHLSVAALAAGAEDVQLRDLNYQKRAETTKFDEFCIAERKWIEFDEKPAFAMKTINIRIRKDMTVGKKLRESDCPQKAGDPSRQETYVYSNHASASGRLGRLLGIVETVFFPGGSGRISKEYKTFDLKSGKLFNIEACLKPDALKKVTELHCSRIKAKASDLQMDEGAIASECRMPQFQFIVQNDGFNVATWTRKARVPSDETPLIETSRLSEYFKPGCLPE